MRTPITDSVPPGSRICGHAMASQDLKAKMLMDLNGPTRVESVRIWAELY